MKVAKFLILAALRHVEQTYSKILDQKDTCEYQRKRTVFNLPHWVGEAH